MKQKQHKLALFLAIFFGFNTVLLTIPQKAHALTRSIVFPVVGPASYVDDFNYARPGYARHGATDIMAKKGQLLVSAITGTVVNVNYPQPSWGWSVTIRDSEGWKYTYIHMNNDNPGTNDNRGGPMNAYGQDMQEGNVVVRGQFLGWVGDSGKSNGVPHLHFEMETPGGTLVNPYSSLRASQKISRPVVHPKMPNEIMPFRADLKIGVTAAMGNFDGDAASETVTGAGPGGGPVVSVWDDNDALMYSFYAYNPGFPGGVDVGTGDVDGDGTDEIITGAGAGGGPHVRVLEPNGAPVAEFMAYNVAFTGGVNVDGGDVDGDGEDEIITGAASRGGPHVRVLELDATPEIEFMAYDPHFYGGVDVTSADVTGTSEDEIITGAGPGGGPHVGTFLADGTMVGGFYAYSPSLGSGVRVSAANVRNSTATAEIYTVPYRGSVPCSRLYLYNGTRLEEKFFLEEWWVGTYDVAAGVDTSKGAAGVNRRATIRDGIEEP